MRILPAPVFACRVNAVPMLRIFLRGWSRHCYGYSFSVIKRFCPSIVWLASFTAIAETDRVSQFANIAYHPERTAPATVLSLNDTIVSSQLTAVVKRVDARVSQVYQRGDVLVELDCTDYHLAREMAEARLASAEAGNVLAVSQLARAAELLEKGLTSQQQYDSREAEALSSEALMKQQRVALKRADVDIQRCVVTAPFNGIVTQRSVAVGQLASMAQPLVSIVDIESLELSANISIADAKLFDQRIKFLFDFGDQLPVTLYNAGGVVNSQTRNIEMRFLFSAIKPPPGSAGRLLWRDPRPFLPQHIIVRRKSEHGIFLYDADTQKVRFHILDNAVPGRPTVADLPPSTLVVTKDIGKLNDGDSLD